MVGGRCCPWAVAAVRNALETIIVAVPPPPFTATVLGLPRPGPDRELERAVEDYRSGTADPDQLHATARALREAQLSALADGGLDSIPVGTSAYGDHLLDTAFMLGAVPARVLDLADPSDRYLAAAQGTGTIDAMRTAPWFDTGHRYLVPEIDRQTRFTLDAGKLLAELAEATALGVPARPVTIGPLTFLTMSRHTTGDPLDRLAEIVPLYQSLFEQLADAGASWVQLDEPILGTALTTTELSRLRAAYAALCGTPHRPAVLVATPFGHNHTALAALADMGIDGVALDFTAGATLRSVASVPALTRKLVVAGVVDGRTIEPTDLDTALSTLGALLGIAGSVAVSSSCSLHVPTAPASAPGLDTRRPDRGADKVAEIRILATALTRGTEAVATELRAARESSESRRTMS
ncbi:hypothetical protein [Nocardia grenadensis]|uniref:hypothetical protein n=1 Tax=Nocardia grenadensis TaxID=931537 RepID=UPI003D8EBEC2